MAEMTGIQKLDRVAMSRSRSRSGLLGVALVVDDISKGCNLAFRYPAPPAEGASSFHRLSPSLLAKLFRPKSALCNQSFELSVDDLRFVSHPVLVSSPSASSNSSSSSSSSSSGRRQNETTMFNIIFALEKRALRPSDPADAGRRTVRGFHAVAAQLANGLLHEELRAGFVSREVRELLHIRDELAQHKRGGGSGAGPMSGTGGLLPNGNAAAGGGGGVGGVGTSGGASHHHHHHHQGAGEAAVEVDQQTFIELSLGKSQLANDLKRVFHGLHEAGMVQVVLNRWVKLALTLSDAVDVQMQSMRPYHTLLLLQDEETILDALPPDHSRQLRVLIEAVNPLKSFQDLALETCIPIHQLFRLAAHLVYWGVGRVIDAVTLHNIYQVHTDAELGVQALPAQEFRRKFPPYELCEVLSTFSGSRRIGEYMKTLSSAKKVEYIHMLIWLLQRNFIVQLHRYIYFMIPSDGDYAPESDSFDNQSSYQSHHHHHHRRRVRTSSSGGSSMFDSTPPLDSGGMSPEILTNNVDDMPMAQVVNVASQLLFSEQERDYLAKIAKPNPVFQLFKRLCVYFHGQHHLEEIMWRENLSRGELRTVVRTYQDIIVCCTHE